MPDLDRSRLPLYVALGLVVCLLGARYVLAQASSAPADGADRRSGGSTAAPSRPAGDGAAVRIDRAGGGRVTVHVAGAVRRPGVYRLAPGARVDDALRRAGGPRGRADLAAVNLAAKLEDGRQVLVPERAPTTEPGAAPAAHAAAAAGGAAAPPLNLNTATLEQLDTLDGVGPGIAQRILDYREQHGGFTRVEELGEVPGIGAKRLAALTPLVTV
ncbi:MAG TPA: helix-hairpin-helix domain-containing protein [Solirubrobacteraceae bacterium]|nr:helix-hairpin-helix domain-containing protein [Solirubrobacteraceae bacterium]